MFKRFRACGIRFGPGGRLRKRRNPWLLCVGDGDGRPRRQLIASSHGAHDIGFDDDVSRTADHQEMLDVVAPYQDQTAASVHRGRIDHGL